MAINNLPRKYNTTMSIDSITLARFLDTNGKYAPDMNRKEFFNELISFYKEKKDEEKNDK